MHIQHSVGISESYDGVITTKRNEAAVINKGISEATGGIVLQWMLIVILSFGLFVMLIIICFGNYNDRDTGKIAGTLSVFSIFAGLGLWLMVTKLRKLQRRRDQLVSTRDQIESEIATLRSRLENLLRGAVAVTNVSVEQAKDQIERGVVAAVPTSATNVDEKVCPMCAETIKAAAKICRYCQHKFA